MKNNTIVTVIVPVFNVEKYIEKCIRSLLDQTLKNFKVLLVDDGSTDQSIEIAKSAFGDDDRFSIYFKENGGLSDARNFGLALVKSELVSFLDSDDYYHPMFLEEMCAPFHDMNVDITFCDVVLVDEGGMRLADRKNFNEKNKVTPETVFLSNLRCDGVMSMAQNKVFRTRTFETLRFPIGLYYEDRATTYKAFLDSNAIGYIAKPLFYYLQRSGSIMNSYSRKKSVDRFVVLESIKQELISRKLFAKYERHWELCYIQNCLISGLLMVFKNAPFKFSEYIYILKSFDFNVITFRNINELTRINRLKGALAFMLWPIKIVKG